MRNKIKLGQNRHVYNFNNLFLKFFITKELVYIEYSNAKEILLKSVRVTSLSAWKSARVARHRYDPSSLFCMFVMYSFFIRVSCSTYRLHHTHRRNGEYFQCYYNAVKKFFVASYADCRQDCIYQ